MPDSIEQVYNDYKHEFAVWTACRAVQRGFVKTDLLKKAIEACDLRGQIEVLKNEKIDADYYDRWHLVIAAKMIVVFNFQIKRSGKTTGQPTNIKKPVMTYGRAAKMIAVYIKTNYIISEPESQLARYAHPPVDRKLLLELRKNFESEFEKVSYQPWTRFDDKSYFETIKILRSIQARQTLKYFWMIEKYWTA